jgi:hypothetical protein
MAVRSLNALITIGGTSIPIISGGADQEATRRSSTMHALCALKDFPGREAFFASLSDNSGAIYSGSTALVDGEWDTASIDLVDGLVRLSGRDKSAALHEKKSSEKFNNMSRSEVVQKVAGRNGLQAQVDNSSLKAGKLFQIDWAKLTDGVSDAAIIHKLAELEGARWWVKGTTLYFKGKSDISSNYAVQYRAPAGGPASGNFIRLSFSINLQAAKTLNGNGGTLTWNYRHPGLEQDHADDLALKKLAEHSRHELTVDVEMVGDPQIDVGMGLQLQGTAFDQVFEMDAVHHMLGPGGHTMKIIAKSAKEGRSAS